ncbi:MAG: septal ring lytic transglycosylase RlpA family protein [Terracidiphilus sp.]|nr:septal ring lytic transglycosylase RlpA family protein [Terracidiphilus sp.]
MSAYNRLGRLPRAAGMVALALALVATGCGHKHKKQPPPQQTAPPVYPTQPPTPAPAPGSATGRISITPLPPGGITAEDKEFVLTHRPIYSEEGYATWYTAPYKGRKAANGQVFDDNALTAAHRTLPMGSLVVVTNLATRQQSAMRISDRGPFVEGRNLDLTIAAAKSIGVYRAGTAPVRIDVFQTPKPIETGGRWCVQFGAFQSEDEALRFKQRLMRQYPDAKVIEFPGEKSFWVRIRPAGDDRDQAESIAHRVQPEEGDGYLTRLD